MRVIKRMPVPHDPDIEYVIVHRPSRWGDFLTGRWVRDGFEHHVRVHPGLAEAQADFEEARRFYERIQ